MEEFGNWIAAIILTVWEFLTSALTGDFQTV